MPGEGFAKGDLDNTSYRPKSLQGGSDQGEVQVFRIHKIFGFGNICMHG